jgi:RNase P subunit RPR2
MLASERNTLNRALKNRGFGGFDDPEMIRQVAFCVRDHDHLRQILCAVEPDQRTLAFESMRPHLRFEAKPLDVYLAEAADLAARKQADQTPLEIAAEKAIARNMADEKKKGALTVKCTQCTKAFAFPGESRKDAERLARVSGWKVRRYVDSGGSQLVVFCPDCAKLRAH